MLATAGQQPCGQEWVVGPKFDGARCATRIGGGRAELFSRQANNTWNHGLGEIIGGLLEAGMELTAFEEHRSMPTQLVPGAVARDEHEEWHLRGRPDRLPLSYTLQARKASAA
jgi:hypothetical protein